MKMRLAKLMISVMVLMFLVWWADVKAILNRLQDAEPLWLASALATLTALTFLMTKRWQIVASALHIELPYSRALAEYYISQLVNVVVPGGIVGDVGRVIRIRHDGDLVRAAQSVAVERLIGQVAIFATMVAGFICALLVPGGIDWPSIIWLVVVAFVGSGVVAGIIARGASPTARLLRLAFTLIRSPYLITNTAIITVLLMFSLYACARATGTVIPNSAVFTLIPLILSAMLIPLSVGGWGWREGAAAALFPMIGASPSAGIATGIVYGALMTLAALPALICLASARPPKTIIQTTNSETL